MPESVKKIVLYNAETGEQLELNGAQDISLAEDVIAENIYKAVIDFDREITGSCRVTDQMALLRMKLMGKSWAGILPRIRIRRAFWPWR